jgi:GntR family transcriptional regulator
VRQATDCLVRRGMLERRRGAGTFVLQPRDQVDLFHLSGTHAAFEEAGLSIELGIVEPLVLIRKLGLDAGPLASQAGYVFSRLGRIEASPLLLERVTISQAVFPDFERYLREGESLARFVERHYHRRPSGGQQLLRVTRLGAAESKLLEVETGDPAMLVERTLDFPGAPGAIFVRSCILTERVALSQTMTEPSGAFGMALQPERPR